MWGLCVLINWKTSDFLTGGLRPLVFQDIILRADMLAELHGEIRVR